MTASDNRVTAIRNSVGSPKTIGDEIFDFSILFMGMTHRTTGPRPIVFLPLPDVFEYNYTTFYDFFANIAPTEPPTPIVGVKNIF